MSSFNFLQLSTKNANGKQLGLGPNQKLLPARSRAALLGFTTLSFLIFAIVHSVDTVGGRNIADFFELLSLPPIMSGGLDSCWMVRVGKWQRFHILLDFIIILYCYIWFIYVIAATHRCRISVIFHAMNLLFPAF